MTQYTRSHIDVGNVEPPSLMSGSSTGSRIRGGVWSNAAPKYEAVPGAIRLQNTRRYLEQNGSKIRGGAWSKTGPNTRRCLEQNGSKYEAVSGAIRLKNHVSNEYLMYYWYFVKLTNFIIFRSTLCPIAGISITIETIISLLLYGSWYPSFWKLTIKFFLDKHIFWCLF